MLIRLQLKSVAEMLLHEYRLEHSAGLSGGVSAALCTGLCKKKRKASLTK